MHEKGRPLFDLFCHFSVVVCHDAGCQSADSVRNGEGVVLQGSNGQRSGEQHIGPVISNRFRRLVTLTNDMALGARTVLLQDMKC
jgi:hypothetical protein